CKLGMDLLSLWRCAFWPFNFQFSIFNFQFSMSLRVPPPCYPKDPLVALVRSHADDYRRFAASIAPPPPPAPQAIYERYLFALLSRHCALTRTVRAFQLLRGRCHPDPEPLAAILRE